MQLENVELTYENFITAYYSSDAETFFSFSKLLEDKLITKYMNRLTKEKKLLENNYANKNTRIFKWCNRTNY